MRAFILFAALLLLALQAQAKVFQVDETLEQEQLGKENQDIAISFEGDESSALQDIDVRSGWVCYCRSGACSSRERIYGVCSYRGFIFRLCCRRT